MKINIIINVKSGGLRLRWKNTIVWLVYMSGEHPLLGFRESHMEKEQHPNTSEILKDLEHSRRSVICAKWGLTHFSLMKIICDQYTVCDDNKTPSLRETKVSAVLKKEK